MEKNKNEKLVVCLSQAGNTGKTGVLMALADILINTRGYPVARWIYPAQSPSSISAAGEICVEITIPVMGDEKSKLVGLHSHGDCPAIVSENMTILVNDGCDIIFCASHTSRSESYKEVQKIAHTNGYTLVWTTPYNQDPDPNLPLPVWNWPLNIMKARHLEDFI